MRPRRIKTPSPPTAIALLALFVALTGTAFAATLPRNSVGSKQIKKNAVTSAKIRRNAVTGAKIRTGAVLGGDVKNDSLTGDDVNESTLGNVSAATSAQNVNGATIAKINYRAPAGAGLTEVFNAAGLKLSAECLAGTADIFANTATDNALLFWNIATVGEPGANLGNMFVKGEESDLDIAETLDFKSVSNISNAWVNDGTQTDFTYAAAGGAIVTGTFTLYEAPNLFGDGTSCAIVGNATVTP